MRVKGGELGEFVDVVREALELPPLPLEGGGRGTGWTQRKRCVACGRGHRASGDVCRRCARARQLTEHGAPCENAPGV